MHRYLSSFIITALLYVSAIASMLYAFNADSYSTEDIEVHNVSKVSFTIITPENKPKKEKRIEQKPKPKPKPKPIKNPTPKPEPIVKEPLPEPVKEEPKPKEKKIVNQNSDDTTSNEMTKAKKQLFIADLMKRINSNKSYPHTARRRCIQGVVEIKFIILADGSVKHINMIYGKDIFEKSAIQAIKRSFPVNVDTSLFSFPKEFKIKIAYILK